MDDVYVYPIQSKIITNFYSYGCNLTGVAAFLDFELDIFWIFVVLSCCTNYLTNICKF